jgi:hypothetical protein
MDEAISLARARRAFLLQLLVPASHHAADPTLLSDVQLPTTEGHARGSVFDVALAPGFMSWVDFPDVEEDALWRTTLLHRFNENTRRNIARSQAEGLEVREATEPGHLRQAYAAIERNGEEQGYPVRSWGQFGETLLEQVAKGQAVVLTTHHGDELLGAHYAVTAGRRYQYLMGGTLGAKPDRRVGHFLHWNAMLKAHAMGLHRYDMSFDQPHYYALGFRGLRAFRHLWPHVKRHKALVARLLHAFQGGRALSCM